MMYGSYYCNEPRCNWRFHKDCAESPLEINHHPSHLEHPLLLTSPDDSITPCDFCGQYILSTYYTCPTCEFKVDLICGTKPSPLVIKHPVCHDHTLVFLKKQIEEYKVPCEVCKESIGGPSYSCLECNNVYFHLDCVHLSKEVDHNCHSSHSLKIMPSESFIDDDDAHKICHFCLVQPEKVLYHCSICNFTLCLDCTKRPPPFVVDNAKTHTHPLMLFSKKIVFTCNVAGIESDSYKSYICLKCDFVITGSCVGLPSIININRHDHRIAFTHHLGYKGAKCGVCRKNVSQYYGAYSCAICPEYVVHSRCATDFDVWNGKELEGIPETSEDIVPFKVIGDNLIRHFFHDKHILLLFKNYDMIGDDYYYERLRCEACASQIGFGPVYSCQECRFFLHEKCAHLPMKKNLVFRTTPYKLEYHQSKAVYCYLCDMFFGGFTYEPQGPYLVCVPVDVHCSSISEPFVHNGHLHPLYFVITNKERRCDACWRVPDGYYMLTCSDCDFDLCLYCATLPEKIWHISDEHPITLYHGGKEAISKNWCEVCEMELDSSKWFFTCSDCGVTFHVGCVLGDFSRLTPNCSIHRGGKEHLAKLNHQSSRPFCRHCHDRCKAPVILQVNDEHSGYICSRSCLLWSC
ncbi:Cysteine/Histidine-rich C1 domain family protein [Raphanus sativus]|nr:Cysteine/Histidine-rich C1 domain family protein [Raphanus sativus]